MSTSNKTPEDNNPSTQPDERTLREERILDAAAALLVRWGYRKTSIDDVAREAGVGKGTIYLHWKSKNDLFRAAIWRANRQVSEDLKQRIAADPEGGLPHRLWLHAMFATLANPLITAMIKGQSDLFQGLMDAFDEQARHQLVGYSDTYVVHLQQAGLIRPDLPVPIITYLMAILKVGMIAAPDLLGQEYLPPMEQVGGALSDLLHRWLSPAQLPPDTTTGKQFLSDWLDNVLEMGEHHEH